MLASAWNPRPGSMDVTTAMVSGSRPAGRRNKNALTMLNIVAFTAIPRAKVNTAMVVNPGFLRNCLSA